MVGQRWERRVRDIRADLFALYLACRDGRVPWYAKVVAGLVVAYAVSPIDLIPDFIPVVGYLDDLLLLPAGILLARRMISPLLLANHRATAGERLAEMPLFTWAGVTLTIGIWLVIAGGVLLLLR